MHKSATPTKASGLTIFSQARDADVIIVTKDIDFVQLLERHGPPPRVLWVTCGNVSNADLEEPFSTAWQRVVEAFASGKLSSSAPEATDSGSRRLRRRTDGQRR